MIIIIFIDMIQNAISIYTCHLFTTISFLYFLPPITEPRLLQHAPDK